MASAKDFLASTFDLSAKAVLITGASSGFGEHFARIFAKAGCRTLALLARRTEKLQGLAQELKESYPGIVVVPVGCDVAKPENIASAFDEAERNSDGKTFDVIVNNAGIGPVIKILNETQETFDQVSNVNVRGCFFVAQEASRRLIAKKMPGSIVNISSIYGLRVGYGHATYSLTKAALTHMTKAFSIEFARSDIRCNSVHPGYFITEMTEEYYSSEKGKEFMKRHFPKQRLGELDELNGVMLLLASDASKFMYGAEITVDGAHNISSL